MTQQVNLFQSEFSNMTFPFFAETLMPALGAVMAATRCGRPGSPNASS